MSLHHITKGNSKIELCDQASCGFYKIEKKEILLFYSGKIVHGMESDGELFGHIHM